MTKISAYSNKARNNQTVQEKRVFFMEFQQIYAEDISEQKTPEAFSIS